MSNLESYVEIPLEDQMRILQCYLPAAATHLLRMVHEPGVLPGVCQVSMLRARAAYVKYKSASWNKGVGEVMSEGADELADLLVYIAVADYLADVQLGKFKLGELP